MRRRTVLFTVVIVFAAMASVSALADHHEKKDHGFFREQKEHASGESHKDNGNETTGQMAAWLFAVANFPAAGTLLTRWFLRAKTSGNSQKTVGKLYIWVKKYLMPFHYVFNPVAIIIALIHFKLSWCRSTNLPEWALLLVSVLGLTGIVIKFRLIPQPLIPRLRAIHTHPIVVVVVFGLLYLGHQFLD